ncbi:reductive dehalogenase [Candidatus Bathyarchaeota archaeon]|nr:MAG: reductive dehalogenase [Candidatus Bathyarchaeota archaeon]
MPKKTFDEIYHVKEDYRRFDARETAFGQALKKTGKMLEFSSLESRAKRIISGRKGFSLLDYAFHDAAGMYETPFGERHTQDRGFYKWQSLGAAKKYPGVGKWEASPIEASRIVKKAGMFYGAGDVGFAQLDKRWVYSHTRYGKPIVFDDVEEGYTNEEKAVIPESHKWVIVLTVPMDIDNFQYAPSATESASSLGYSKMHFLAGMVAEFIRGLGYHAIPCGNDTALSVPMAVQAGLGHLGRHGRLITWSHGSMVRILKIFTDLPLDPSPMAPEGIIQFCETCMKCAKHCPSKALSFGEREHTGVCDANNPGSLKWYVDAEKCLEYWNTVEAGCGICFRVCAFNKKPGPLHDTVKWFIRNVPILNPLWIFADEFIGYGKQLRPDMFWK